LIEIWKKTCFPCSEEKTVSWRNVKSKLIETPSFHHNTISPQVTYRENAKKYLMSGGWQIPVWLRTDREITPKYMAFTTTKYCEWSLDLSSNIRGIIHFSSSIIIGAARFRRVHKGPLSKKKKRFRWQTT
jgi:hypothetical protein